MASNLEFTKPVLVVDTTQTVTSHDSKGEWKHYKVSLFTKEDEKIEITQYPIDVKKYGNIEQIIIDEGSKKTILKAGSIAVGRLIHYFSTDFEKFRKEINADKVDHNGCYSNKDTKFDCQKFSYYLQHGKEGKYAYKYGSVAHENYRNAVRHKPIRFYSLRGETAQFGNDGKYSEDDYYVHHYICLTDNVFVSKFGENDVCFTSYPQILDAYFPKMLNRGNFYEEYF